VAKEQTQPETDNPAPRLQCDYCDGPHEGACPFLAKTATRAEGVSAGERRRVRLAVVELEATMTTPDGARSSFLASDGWTLGLDGSAVHIIGRGMHTIVHLSRCRAVRVLNG